MYSNPNHPLKLKGEMKEKEAKPLYRYKEDSVEGIFNVMKGKYEIAMCSGHGRRNNERNAKLITEALNQLNPNK